MITMVFFSLSMYLYQGEVDLSFNLSLVLCPSLGLQNYIWVNLDLTKIPCTQPQQQSQHQGGLPG